MPKRRNVKRTRDGWKKGRDERRRLMKGWRKKTERQSEGAADVTEQFSTPLHFWSTFQQPPPDPKCSTPSEKNPSNKRTKQNMNDQDGREHKKQSKGTAQDQRPQRMN